MLSVGIVGKPNAGKSTLFNALTNQNVPAENYPFCTIDKNTGVVAVPDERLDKLVRLFDSKERIPATVTFVDIAGLVAGASQGEGLGNMFLAHIREVELIIFLLGAYEQESEPIDDLTVVETELILKDIETVEKRYQKTKKEKKYEKKGATASKFDEVALLERLLSQLNNNIPAIAFSQNLEVEEQDYIREMFLLSNKKYLITLNISEKTSSETVSQYKQQIIQDRAKKGITLTEEEICIVNAKLEYEISRLSDTEKNEYIEALGIEYIGMPAIIKRCYTMLNYITFYTGDERMMNAWQIINGTSAKEAAGVIHTDLMNKFIRADVLSFEDIVACGGWKEARANGKIKTVGKEYVLQDGDLMIVMHN
ncbi:MAG TPA: redox-regulated ATPase YchF [Candidatus Dojkabacteria bacterium]|nr:redox-regulated ATPase YchF [Candidatus Dojkabacteria bacterium]HQF36863.1 redox-regulated ATPase YchF [Candidatus Dojkabacteria bacterium]